MMNMPVAPPTISPSKQNRNSKEIAILTERQRLFKEAALEAKREGNVKVALVYLKHAKVYLKNYYYFIRLLTIKINV